MCSLEAAAKPSGEGKVLAQALFLGHHCHLHALLEPWALEHTGMVAGERANGRPSQSNGFSCSAVSMRFHAYGRGSGQRQEGKPEFRPIFTLPCIAAQDLTGPNLSA